MFLAFAGHGRDQGNAVCQLQGGFKALGEPLLQALFHLEPVDHHINLVFALFIQRRYVVDVVNGAVDPQADKALAAHGIDYLQVFAFAIPDDRGQDHQLAAFRHGHHLVDHLAHGLGFQRLAVVRAAGFAGAGEQQAQVVVYLGNGTHSGARVV